MNKKIIAFIAVFLLIVGGLYFVLQLLKSPSVKPNSAPSSSNIQVNPQKTLGSPKETKAAQKDTSTSSAYSPEVRAKIREEFITNCTKEYGSQYSTACSCGADYLGSHYSDEVLKKMYITYHATGKVTAEFQKAIDVCKDK